MKNLYDQHGTVGTGDICFFLSIFNLSSPELIEIKFFKCFLFLFCSKTKGIEQKKQQQKSSGFFLYAVKKLNLRDFLEDPSHQ